jgi:hypothetical protein
MRSRTGQSQAPLAGQPAQLPRCPAPPHSGCSRTSYTPPVSTRDPHRHPPTQRRHDRHKHAVHGRGHGRRNGTRPHPRTDPRRAAEAQGRGGGRPVAVDEDLLAAAKARRTRGSPAGRRPRRPRVQPAVLHRTHAVTAQCRTAPPCSPATESGVLDYASAASSTPAGAEWEHDPAPNRNQQPLTAPNGAVLLAISCDPLCLCWSQPQRTVPDTEEVTGSIPVSPTRADALIQSGSGVFSFLRVYLSV